MHRHDSFSAFAEKKVSGTLMSWVPAGDPLHVKLLSAVRTPHSIQRLRERFTEAEVAYNLQSLQTSLRLLASEARLQITFGTLTVTLARNGSRVIAVDRAEGPQPAPPSGRHMIRIQVSGSFLELLKGAITAVSSNTRPKFSSSDFLPWINLDEARDLLAALHSKTCDVYEFKFLRLITACGSFIFATQESNENEYCLVTAIPHDFAQWVLRKGALRTRNTLISHDPGKYKKDRSDAWASCGKAQMLRFMMQLLIRKHLGESPAARQAAKRRGANPELRRIVLRKSALSGSSSERGGRRVVPQRPTVQKPTPKNRITLLSGSIRNQSTSRQSSKHSTMPGNTTASKGLAGRGGAGAGAAIGGAAPSRVGDAVESAGAAGTTQDDDQGLALALALSLEAGKGPVSRVAATGGGASSAPRKSESLPGSAALPVKLGPEGPAQRRWGPGPPYVRRADGTSAGGSGGGGAATIASHARGPLPPAGVGSRHASASAEVRVGPSVAADKVKVKTLDGEGATETTGAPLA